MQHTVLLLFLDSGAIDLNEKLFFFKDLSGHAVFPPFFCEIQKPLTSKKKKKKLTVQTCSVLQSKMVDVNMHL